MRIRERSSVEMKVGSYYETKAGYLVHIDKKEQGTGRFLGSIISQDENWEVKKKSAVWDHSGKILLDYTDDEKWIVAAKSQQMQLLTEISLLGLYFIYKKCKGNFNRVLDLEIYGEETESASSGSDIVYFENFERKDSNNYMRVGDTINIKPDFLVRDSVIPLGRIIAELKIYVKDGFIQYKNRRLVFNEYPTLNTRAFLIGFEEDDDFSVFLLTPVIEGFTEAFDSYTCGNWDTKEKAIQWLEKYDTKEKTIQCLEKYDSKYG